MDTFGPRLHTYGPDAGIPELRHALARKLADYNGVAVDPERQLIVTPGSNQAFMVAMMTILDRGDEVAIVSPYYFNHHMAIQLCGGVVREIPLSEETGFQMSWDDVEPVLTPGPGQLSSSRPIIQPARSTTQIRSLRSRRD